MKVIRSPKGTLIKGTLEQITGVALIVGIGADGEPEYAGDTEVYWDEQKTVYRPKHDENWEGSPQERVFVDESGDEFLQSELIITEEEEICHNEN